MIRKTGYLAGVGIVAGLGLAAGPPALAEVPWNRAPLWGPGELVIAAGGCPIEAPDAQSLLFASGRAGGAGGTDIWVIDRDAVGAAWSEPKNLPWPINSTAADFCPSPFDRSLLFVSTRAGNGACGMGDIYLSRQSPAGDWSDPIHLPCAPDGPNTSEMERSPSLVVTHYGTFLFYSSNGGVSGADDDIYVSRMDADGDFGPGQIVRALSTDGFQDQMPTVRARRGGDFEVTFNSDRTGWGPRGTGEVYGGQDVYYSRSPFLPFWWSAPVNAGPNVNTDASETRASLSADGRRLYYGRGDIYVSERQGP